MQPCTVYCALFLIVRIFNFFFQLQFTKYNFFDNVFIINAMDVTTTGIQDEEKGTIDPVEDGIPIPMDQAGLLQFLSAFKNNKIHY